MEKKKGDQVSAGEVLAESRPKGNDEWNRRG